jgi:transcriptional regulator with XRE-family HTH domain
MDLKETLKSRGIMQRFIAKQAQISDSMLSRYLSGKRRMPEEIRQKLIKILKDNGIFFE